MTQGGQTTARVYKGYVSLVFARAQIGHYLTTLRFNNRNVQCKPNSLKQT